MTGATGAGLTAWAEIWPGAIGTADTAPKIARGSSSNVTSVAGGAPGQVNVFVSGCTTAGLAEPVVTVSANADPNDNNETKGAVAQAQTWSIAAGDTPSEPLLDISVSTQDPRTLTNLDSDFAIQVKC